MSMPKFPEIDPEMTCDRALNMILASIAMEELALSHIINAEGEKLQYVLGTLETSGCVKPDIDEILKVNHSVTCLLDSVSQNQMILKNKMDKALHALSEICPKPPCPPVPPCPPGPQGPPGPPGDRGPAGPPGSSCCKCICSAAFKSAEKCKLWCAGSALTWKTININGKCVCLDTCDKTKVVLCSKGRFVISFAVNMRSNDCTSNAAVSLQMIENHQRKDIYTVRSYIPGDDEAVTAEIGGIIVENCDPASALIIKLESPDLLIVEDAMLSIVEI